MRGQEVCPVGAVRLLGLYSLGDSRCNLLKQTRDNFVTRSRAEITLAMHPHTDGVRFQVAFPDHEHGVHFHLLGAGDLGFDVVATGVELGADLVGAELVVN
jgi:hypothetical protein